MIQSSSILRICICLSHTLCIYICVRGVHVLMLIFKQTSISNYYGQYNTSPARTAQYMWLLYRWCSFSPKPSVCQRSGLRAETSTNFWMSSLNPNYDTTRPDYGLDYAELLQICQNEKLYIWFRDAFLVVPFPTEVTPIRLSSLIHNRSLYLTAFSTFLCT